MAGPQHGKSIAVLSRLGAMKRGAAKQHLHALPINNARQRPPGHTQYIGVFIGGVNAKPAHFGHWPRKLRKARQVIILRRIAGTNRPAIGQGQQAKHTNQGAIAAIFYQDMLANFVKFIAIQPSHPVKTQMPQALGGSNIGGAIGKAHAVAPFGENWHWHLRALGRLPDTGRSALIGRACVGAMTLRPGHLIMP